MHRALESSDPFVSNIRLNKRLNRLKRQSLLPQAFIFLEPFGVPTDEEEADPEANITTIENDLPDIFEMLSKDVDFDDS